MKKWTVASAIMLALSGALVLQVARARAQSTDAAQMSEAEAMQWDNAVLHLTHAQIQLRELAAAAKKIEEEAKPYQQSLVALGKKHSINLDEVGKTITVDVKTGKITRTPAPPAPSVTPALPKK